MSLRKKSFTLIEMLIVVVIIGILAAALIPRLQGVQGRARDVQRKANLSQIGQGMGVFKSDNNDTYTNGIYQNMPFSGQLVPSYLAAVPTDPRGTSWNLTDDFTTTSGNYAAFTTTNWGILVLAAKTEIKNSSNGTASYSNFTGSMTMAQAQSKIGTPSVDDGNPLLRYYYIQ